MSTVLKAVLLGQLLALLIAITASTSTALAQEGVSLPTLQSLTNYVLLTGVYGISHWRNVKAEGSNRPRLSKPVWQYAALAFMDVEANFLLVTAYRHTSITSVTLLDCASIPLAVLLTRLFLGSVYKKGHYAGAVLCIAGLFMLVLSDQQFGAPGEGEGQRSSALFGDLLVVMGASLYACCNVFQEALLDDVAVSELLFMLGACGSIISFLQLLPLELHTALSTQWSPTAVLPFLGFGASLFCFYSLVPFELQWGGAAILNLSLLSSDLWTACARFAFFGGFTLAAGSAFFISFAVVSAGIAVYVRAGEVKSHEEAGAYLPVDGQGTPAASVGDEEGQRLPAVDRNHTSNYPSQVALKGDVELGSSPSQGYVYSTISIANTDTERKS